MANIGIVGAGRWGTTLALILWKNEHHITLFDLPEEIKALKSHRENRKYLPGYLLPSELIIKTGLDELDESDSELEVLIFTVPGIALESVAAEYVPKLNQEVILVSAVKTLYLEERKIVLPTQKIAQFGNQVVVCLAFAAFPQDILWPKDLDNSPKKDMKIYPAQGTVAGEKSAAEKIQSLFEGTDLRPYTDDDVLGLCYGCAAKNALAIAFGIADSLGFGDSALGMLFSRGSKEIVELGELLGAKPKSFIRGSIFWADLYCTCTSILFRNRNFGFDVGTGKSESEAKKQAGGVVEGIETSRVILELAKFFGIEMPITEVTNLVIHHQISPVDGAKRLLNRTLKPFA